MVKTFPSRQRRGVALLITLVTIAMIVVLIGALYTMLDDARKDSTRTTALIQANLLYVDIASILDKLKGQQELLNLLYMMPLPLASDDASLSLTIGCKPMDAGLNINWLGLETQEANATQPNGKSEAVQALFDKIAVEYNLVDPELLKGMIYAELGVGNKNKYVTNEQSRLLQKRGIISYQQFERILSRYQMEADDANVRKVPWSGLFTFYPETEGINADFMSAELIALQFDMDLALVQREWPLSFGSWEKFAEEQNIEIAPDDYFGKVFSKEKGMNAQCDILYGYAGEQYRFAFKYTEEGVKHFEFYGRQ